MRLITPATAKSGLGSFTKLDMREIVGRTFINTLSVSLICGCTLITKPTGTEWAVVLNVFSDTPWVVAVTDNLVRYPACPIDITQDHVDFVVEVDSIGDPQGIVSGTTRATTDPVGLHIASTAAQVIAASGLLSGGH